MIRPSKYVLNTNLATSKNIEEKTMTLIIPNSIYVDSGASRKISSTLTLLEKTASFRCYITSTKYDYAMQGYNIDVQATAGGYNAQFPLCVYRNGNDIIFEATFYGGYGQAMTWENIGQTFTLHIQFFKDPFIA